MENRLFDLARDYMETLLDLPVFLLPNDREKWMEYTTGCIPSFIYSQTKSEYFWSAIQKILPRTIYYLKDDFGFHMLFTALGGSFIVCGPFLPEHAGEDFRHHILERNHINISFEAPLRVYYESLSITEPTAAISGLKVFLRAIHGEREVYVKDLYAPGEEQRAVLFPEEESETHIRQLEQRVEMENQLIAEVRAGNREGAMEMQRRLQLEISHMVRTGDPVRHQKNLCFILNTLLRKAVEAAGVAPFYFDQVFWDYAHLAEKRNTTTDLIELRKAMVGSYVALVLEYSIGNYSPLIQRALNYIHVHLGSRLSLRKIAEAAQVSPQHLSTEFNREMGLSIPEYINRRRADKMAGLLATTHYSVGEIAAFVGFSDNSYATRQFRRAKGISPAEYRKIFVLGDD